MVWFKGRNGSSRAKRPSSTTAVNLYGLPRLPFFRQTFEGQGRFRDIQFCTGNPDAEWQAVVIATHDDFTPFSGRKVIYVFNETPDYYQPRVDFLRRCTAILTTVPFDDAGGVPQFIALPCLSWMYGVGVERHANAAHSFHQSGFLKLEELISAHCPRKSRACSMVVSNQRLLPGHKLRADFTARLRDKLGDKIDYYGFGHRPILDKREALDSYYFSIAIENSAYSNYITEKLTDVYLGHTMPIYYGAPNVGDFFPGESLFTIDITKPDEAIARIDEIISSRETFNLQAVKEARRRVLLEYNAFDLLAQVVERLQEGSEGSGVAAARGGVNLLPLNSAEKTKLPLNRL